MPRVLLFTNLIAPYRLPIFQQLAQEVDLTLLFAQEKSADRRWQTSVDQYTFPYTILPHQTLRLKNASQIINPTLFSQLWRDKFDIAIIGDNRQTVLSGILISLFAWFRRRPFVIWTGITPGESKMARSRLPLQRLFGDRRRWLFRRAAAIIAYGTTTRRYLIQLGIPKEKIFAGTQVIPSEQLPSSAANDLLSIQETKTVTLSLNYLIARKGLDILIQAFRQVAGDDDVLALVGSGPEKARLQQIADGDRRILFPGYQAGAQKSAWYSRADLFVMPTLHDPWGLVVNEAMAFGLPIITTDEAGCAQDLIHDNGLIVPAGDVDRMASALSQLLEDHSLRQQMGSRSQAIIADYTVDSACHTFTKAINYAMERS